MLSLFRTLRRLVTAVWLVVALYCIAEVGVRVWDGLTGKVSRRLGDDPDLLLRSWTLNHELKPQQQVLRKSDGGRTVLIKTNSRGLRGPDLQVPKPRDVYRIVCLGDERILGPHVRESDTFSAQLQKLLQSRSSQTVEVVNAGIPDYCPLLSQIQFEQKLILLQPDLVILNFDMSDVADDYRYRRSVSFDAEGKPISCVHASLDLPQRPCDWLFGDALMLPRWGRHLLATTWCNNTFTGRGGDICSTLGKYRWTEDHPPDWTIHVNHALSPITALRDRSKGLAANFLVTTCPAPFQISSTAGNQPGLRASIGVKPRGLYASLEPFEKIQDFCRSEGVPCCDVSESFRKDPAKDKLFLKSAIELSPTGNALFARNVAVFLVRNISGAWRGVGQPGSSAEPEIAPVSHRQRQPLNHDIPENHSRRVERTP